MGIEIIRPGMLMTVQDLGRFGHQAAGVSPAGAMDGWSAAKANILVGNPRNAGLLEITLGGAALRALTDTVAAICGADMGAAMDGTAVPMNCAFSIAAGQTITFSYAAAGLRSYIAFAGGFDLPMVMGSVATHIGTGVGGYQGRKLEKGDRLAFQAPVKRLSNQELRSCTVDTLEGPCFLRVVMGPQPFPLAGIQTFLHSGYVLRQESDRMGCRLEGPAILQQEGGNMITDGIAFGSVQVPPSGQPIVMMADRQTTGGYPKIATVISADLPQLAQCRPGTAVRFRQVSVAEAQAAYLQQQLALQALEMACQQASQGTLYQVLDGGKTSIAGIVLLD